MTPNEILSEILNDYQKHGKCIAVFDLDSTLFCVSPRSQAILRDLAAETSFEERFPAASHLLSSVEVLPTEYGIKTAMLRSGIAPAPGLVEAVITYWREKFFSNTHMNHDVTYPGAVEFVQRLHQAGVEVYYLTGRNEIKMREGTMRNLKNWNFPNLPLERAIMKPNEADADHVFKEMKLKELAHLAPAVWFFENEPVIVHHVRRELPDVHIVFVDSAHSGKADPPTDLMTVRMDFR